MVGRLVVGYFGDDVGDVGLWVDVVCFVGLDDGVDGGVVFVVCV